MSKSTREILTDTKALILERGWIKNQFENSKGVCLSGALHIAAERNVGSFEDAYRAVSTAAGLTPYAFQICVWNDAPERTLDEVLAALDRAIAATS